MKTMSPAKKTDIQEPVSVPSITRTPEQALQSILDGVAETVINASDEEILHETPDPAKEAEAVRSILFNAVHAAAPEAGPIQPRSAHHAESSSKK